MKFREEGKGCRFKVVSAMQYSKSFMTEILIEKAKFLMVGSIPFM
jgi:hypothetical protein